MFVRSRHYFNNIHSAVVAQILGCAIGLGLLAVVLLVKKCIYSEWLPILPYLLIVCCLLRWFTNMLTESSLLGRYVRKLRVCLCFGFLLFLCSEIMLFGGFFWAYFDRLFNISAEFACFWLPDGLDTVVSFRWPVIGTAILILSGYCVNQSYYLLKVGDYLSHLLYGYATICLALSFLCIQVLEYRESLFTLSDSVYGSSFYLLTGFHGFHVTVGFVFLVEQFERVVRTEHQVTPSYFDYLHVASHPVHKCSSVFCDSCHGTSFVLRGACYVSGSISCLPYQLERCAYVYDRQRNTGMATAIIYWHFVDIIWIFLFFFVYLFPISCA